MTIYNEPLYYEIAFSFINPKKQVDLFERAAKRFSKIETKRFLDIGCGPSLQLREIARIGYEAIGLDINPKMLEYLKQKAAEDGTNIETVKGDMINFRLRKKADFAFIMMGTIGYIKSNEDFLRHLDSVARSLKSGGLYLIENIVLDYTEKKLLKPQTWTMKRGKIKVKTAYKVELKDVLNQMLTETITFDVLDCGKHKFLKERCDRKLIFPQEFLALLKLNNKFEFLGWFERNELKPLKRAKNDNIVLLRKK